MFAVVRYGAKQYKVQKDDVLKLERVEGDEGAVVVLEDVLASGDASGLKIGAKVKVAVEILGQAKDEKKIIFKKRRRQNYRRTRGHRQKVTWVKVQDIGENVQAKAAPAEKKQKKEAAAPAKKAEAKPAEAKKTAAKKPAAKKE